LFIIGWNIVWTSLILNFIKHVLRVPLRMSEEDLLIGDDAIHGVSLYSFAVILGIVADSFVFM
jgi:Amt family ammonium transporter